MREIRREKERDTERERERMGGGGRGREGEREGERYGERERLHFSWWIQRHCAYKQPHNRDISTSSISY